MCEYCMLLLNFLLQNSLLCNFLSLSKTSYSSIQKFLRLGPRLIKAHHFLIVVVVVLLLTHSILKCQTTLQLTIGMRPKREVHLSTFLTEQTPITGKSVVLENKNITAIDLVSPILCSEIQSLNLRKNKLTSLKNITQFAFLKQLDISSNKISNCRQLANLRDMYQLRKVYVSDNPFLSEPLDQPILDFLLQRETDIQILSFEVLNSIREVEEDEIKIIFLKNYLGKIELHQQLKQKQFIRQGRPGMKTEQLIDKIIPQFYTIIDDPNMTTKIRREALDLKRKNNATIQYALKSTKNAKTTKINQLIGDVVNLLHHNTAFKQEGTFRLQVNYDQNTISFSPDREKPFNNSKRIEESEEQFSPVKYMQLSKDNTFQQFSLANSNRHAPQLTNLRQKVPITPATEHFSTNIKLTPPKVPLVEKLNNFSNFKQNYQSELKRIRERQSTNTKNNEFTPLKIEQPILPIRTTETNTAKTKRGSQPAFIKVIQQKDSLETNKEQSRKSPKAQVKNIPQSNVYRNSLMGSRESLSAQTLETIYLRNLSKTNPMFNLLYSPTDSLTEEEKTTILQSLKLDHKQKCIQLMKQRNNNLTLTRELEQARTEFHYKMDSIVGSSRYAFEENVKIKEDYEWLQKRYEDLQTDYHTVFTQLKEVEQRERGKTQAIGIMEGSYNKIKDSYKEKVEELSQLAVLQQKEEKLAERHSSFIKLTCLRLLKNKGTRWFKIIQAMTVNNDKRQHRLKTIGLHSFKLSKQFEDGLKNLNNKRQHAILLQYFREWIFFKQTETRYKLLFDRIKRKRCKMGMNKLKKYEANCKMRKLKNIWADRFLHQRIFDKALMKWKELRMTALNKQQRAINFHKTKILSQYLDSIKLLISMRGEKINIFVSQYQQRNKERQFKRLVHLIRRQQVQLQQKQKQVSRLHQSTLRKTYIQRLKLHTRLIKQINQKYKVLFLKKQQAFSSNLIKYRLSNLTFREKNSKLLNLFYNKATIQKLKLIKYLQIVRLRSKNYIKYRTIKQMNTQMDHNDRNALELVRFTQEEVDIYKRDAAHLKQLILTQQNRQKQLLLKNDSLLHSIKETLDVVDEMRVQISNLERQYLNQLQRNETLAKLYNEVTNRPKGKHVDTNQQF